MGVKTPEDRLGLCSSDLGSWMEESFISIVSGSNSRLLSREGSFHNDFLVNIWGFTEYFVINSII